MFEMIRCPVCRGSKTMLKMGALMGECELCSGKGSIKAIDKPKPVIAEPVDAVNDVVSQVADCLPVSNIDKETEGKLERLVKPKIETLPKGDVIKVDGKRTIYKRKKA